MLKRLIALFVVLVASASCGGGGGSTPTPHAAPTPLPALSALPTPTSKPVPTPTPTPAVTFNDYTTFGYDNGRHVFNPNSTTITSASVANLHLGWQASLNDYNTQTQPILATGIDGHAGILYVGGVSGNVYAYDARTGALLWRQNLGVETFTCGQTEDTFGIGGTAAYDPGSHSLYVVGNTNTGVNVPATNTLYHLDGATGAILGQVDFAPLPLGPTELNFSHTAVTLGPNGLAYVGTGSTCDISSWRGRVAAISVPAMTLAATFFTIWNGGTQPWGGGGVWGWGGVSLDAAGNVFTGVGNADAGVTGNGLIEAPFAAAPSEYSGNAEAFIELSAGLTQEAAHHPIAPSVYGSVPGAGDLDVDGTPIVFTPNGTGCDELAALQSKAGTLSIYDTTQIAHGPLIGYQLAPPNYGGTFFGGPAYSPATGLIYAPVPVGSGSLFPPGMIAINPGCGAPGVTWQTTFGPDSNVSGDGAPRSVPAVSAGGVVFVGTPCAATAAGTCTGSPAAAASRRIAAAGSPRKPTVCCSPPGSAVGGAVWALDASTGAVLSGGNPLLTTPGFLRMPPTIDGNWVFVIDNSGNLYGLTIDQSVPAIAGKYRAPDARSRRPWEPRPTAKQS